MRRKMFHIFILFFFLVACAKQKPDQLIPEDQMVEILCDMQIAHSGVELSIEQEQRNETRESLNASILDQRKVDRTAFYESFTYYKSDPVTFDSLYVNILRKLEDRLRAFDEASKRPNPGPSVPEKPALPGIKNN